MKGRKPKPTVLKLLAGNPGRKPINHLEPQAPGSLSDPPAYLTDTQKQIWRDAIASAPAGVLKTIDGAVLETWVVACDVHHRAAKELESSDLVLITPRGAVSNPLIRIIAAQVNTMIRAGSELGFSPAARPRLKVESAPAQANPFLAYKRDA